MAISEQSKIGHFIARMDNLLAFRPKMGGRKKKHHPSHTHRSRKKTLQDYLHKAGYVDTRIETLNKRYLIMILGIILLATIGVIVAGIVNESDVLNLIGFIISMWGALFFGLWIIFWLTTYFYLDLRIYKRTKELEEVLPDFLQLTSANIFAGMPIDRALWYAIRPRFGVLAREIEEVAKRTIAGEDLEHSLTAMTKKYDSGVLSRSVSLLLEGMKAGGEMSNLLNKIAIDIQEGRILKQEMAANVMTYVIFISFASIVVAPFLFGLATQLLIIITSIMSGISSSASASSGAGFSFNFNADSVSVSDFIIFCYVTLGIGSFFSAAIVSTIQKGTVKDGLKNIPIYILTSWTIYYISAKLVAGMLGDFF